MVKMLKYYINLNIFLIFRYAFVTFSSKESAEQAREGMNGQTIGGQEIKVRICGCRAGRSQDLAGGRGQDSTWSGTN